MGKKSSSDQQQQKEDTKVDAVLDLLRKQYPLSAKQEKFCNSACVDRFLKAKGDGVKKAAKQLRACLSWRDTIGLDNLIADEFSAELAEGLAYVAGQDDESRPVMVFRVKQDYQKLHSPKLLTRLLPFTLEVAIGTMPKNTEQFVLLFDASFFRSASAFMNLLLASLKLVADYYPGRLYKAFVIDPPSLFSYLWKGVRPFVELSAMTHVVSSMDFEESLEFDDFSSYPRAASLRFETDVCKAAAAAAAAEADAAKICSSASSRFSFTVSHHFDSLKPWYLTLTSSSSSKVGPTTTATGGSCTLGPALISPLNARSLSFASPGARTPRGMGGYGYNKKSLFPSTPLPQPTGGIDLGTARAALTATRTPRPSFLQSPATFFLRKPECHAAKAERSGRESFVPFLKFYRRPYDEMIYRSKMKPPLGGLISIVSPHLKRRHMSVSQRF
ncbi:hypothetical protein SAY86_020866 [Trapa natans]|uniref:CRAL-TRIO domain-containing protein n=1 Tax=Trapa natans TaxID=22666 RepID=A0AAN7M7L7_TRANT|nr:hypothetical protein SAY86_020866 [Trapa natans]